MSKLKMLKFEAATLQNRKHDLLEQLQKSGIAQLEKVDDARLFPDENQDKISEYEKRASTVADAMSVLGEYGIDFGVGMFSGRKVIDWNDYVKACDEAEEYLAYSTEIQSLHKSISDSKSEIVRCNTLIDSLFSWQKLDVPAGGVSTQFTSVHVGSFPREYTYEALACEIAAALPHVNEYCFEIVHASKLITCVVVICHRDCEKELMSFLRSLSFTAPADTAGTDVKERLDELQQKVAECESVVESAKKNILAHTEKAEKFKIAFDVFNVKCDEYRALSDVKLSDNTAYITGYVPEKYAGRLSKAIEKSGGAVVFSKPDDDDDVPVLLSNGKFSEPVEGIVEMYAVPGKNDIDPSKVMAFFYYLLFGMMLSDAGYGLVLALGSFLILKFTSVEGGMRRTLRMFVYCGISTLFWGALFGSWFGDAIPVICREFLGMGEIPSIALWFDPISDPITLLLFSFVIGIVHLFIGLGALGYMKWRDGDKIGAFCDTVPIMMTVTGAAPLAAGVLVSVPSAVTGVAKYLAIVGVILIVLTASRSGNIFLRLGGGLYGLYNIASGYLSDILSYSRLLALGLATGCIGSVVNMLAVMVQTPVLKVIVFVVVFILGHTLNMAINVLGAYVHTNRLQFVELFSKFYEGGGRAFNPLKFNTKFFKLKEEIKND